jgi:hypothetical protein
MESRRLELMQVLYRGLAQLGYARAHLVHEDLLLDIMQRAVGDPDFIASLRADAYARLADSGLSDIEKDTLQFIVT